MKKIGILSEYYNSQNYGGNLQAYALCTYLNKKGVLAEQIQYNRTIDRVLNEKDGKSIIFQIKGKIKNEGLGGFIKNRVVSIRNKFLVKTTARKEYEQLLARPKCFSRFNQSIPHSDNVFDDQSIACCCKDYDVFVVGSDQVWRNICNEAYFLGFVPEGITKVSYAASISKDTLNEEEKEFFREKLSSFKAISVREKDAVNLLSELIPIRPEWVVDPTLLLSKEEWDDICSERLIEEKYCFAFFIGEDKSQRKAAIEYSKLNGIKMVTIPYLRGRIDTIDHNSFGKNENVHTMITVSPNEFISLIKYAEVVFTDSFHATVFSIIYNRKFLVFERPEKHSMSSRIRSLLELFNLSERFCDKSDYTEIETIICNQKTNPTSYAGKANQLIEESKIFLQSNLFNKQK